MNQKPLIDSVEEGVQLPSLRKKQRSSQPEAIVTKLEEIPFPKVYKPEAGIYVMNTQHIKEIESKQFVNGDTEKSVNHIEHVVNSKIVQPERGGGYPNIGFVAKHYHAEGMRLSMNPQEVAASLAHPIYKFVPRVTDEEDPSPKRPAGTAWSWPYDPLNGGGSHLTQLMATRVASETGATPEAMVSLR